MGGAPVTRALSPVFSLLPSLRRLLVYSTNMQGSGTTLISQKDFVFKMFWFANFARYIEKIVHFSSDSVLQASAIFRLSYFGFLL